MTGEALAELLERLAEARGLAEACSLVLDRVAGGDAPVRAVVVVCREGQIHGAGWGIAEAAVQAVLARAGDPPLTDWLEQDAPSWHDAAGLPPGFSGVLVLPFFRREPDTRALVLLEAARPDPRAESIHTAFRRCGAAIIRSLELEVLRELNEGLEQRIARATAELEAHNRQLELQRGELERASRLKSEFLANMSHELRTPLNVLLGYAALLRDGVYGGLAERQSAALEKMHMASKHLLQLINDILDLSKIEAGRMALYNEDLRLDDVFAEIAAMTEPLLVDKPLTFVVTADEGLPPLRTDRTRLKQVLFNLVSNAVKFTDSGSIELGAKAIDGGRRVRITVADTGVGIRPEDLPIIFEDFRQLDQSTTKRHGGTGLGLSITRKLVALLGGTIAVESAVAEGTTFIVELPRANAAPADRPSGEHAVRSRERLERAGG